MNSHKKATSTKKDSNSYKYENEEIRKFIERNYPLFFHFNKERALFGDLILNPNVYIRTFFHHEDLSFDKFVKATSTLRNPKVYYKIMSAFGRQERRVLKEQIDIWQFDGSNIKVYACLDALRHANTILKKIVSANTND